MSDSDPIPLSAAKSFEQRRRVLRDPEASVDEIRAYLGALTPRQRDRILVRPSTRPQVIDALAWDPDPDTREQVAHRTDNPEVLVKLLRDPDPRVRGAAAGHSLLPAEHFEPFLKRRPEQRGWVAGNWSAPQALLVRLAGDDDAGVRAAVGRNPAAPASVIASLADDLDAGVRVAVAGNPSASPEVLVALRARREVRVDLALAANEATPPEVLRGLLGWTCPPEQVTALEIETQLLFQWDDGSNEQAIAAQVAMHEWSMTMALEMNPASPPDVLETVRRGGRRE